MIKALAETLHCYSTPIDIHGNTTIHGGTDVSVFERQARMKWQQQQQEQSFFNGNDNQLHNTQSAMSPAQFSGLIGNLVIKPNPGMQNGWPDFSGGSDDQLSYGCGLDHMNQNTHSGMTSCPPSMADQTILQRNSSPVSLSPKKRKTHENKKLKVVSEENGIKEKKIKGCSQGDSIETSSKEKPKLTEVQKPDYIHVRARRGQATDSHSLAERVRREKISERMKYLQDLVPGCNKITGKAGMLDEIINYVQSLQKQVEFLSMKLAAVYPRSDLDIDYLITKEVARFIKCIPRMVSSLLVGKVKKILPLHSNCHLCSYDNQIFMSATGNFPAVRCSSEMANFSYFQLNSLLETGPNPIDMVLRRSISAPASIPETYVDSACFNQMQPNVTWDADLQNLYRMEFQQGISTTPYQPQKFTGSDEGSNLKMEM